MRFDEKQARLQAVLFASGEPVELRRLGSAALLSEDGVREAVERINAFYRQCRMPFEIALLSGSAQMCALPEYAALIRDTLSQSRSAPLSQAAMETLAIVAYNQPVTKAFVEQVRGVDSSGVMNALAQKQLIEEAGRLELPGRPVSYRTTAHFLRCFSLSSLDELPQVEESPAGERDSDGPESLADGTPGETSAQKERPE